MAGTLSPQDNQQVLKHHPPPYEQAIWMEKVEYHQIPDNKNQNKEEIWTGKHNLSYFYRKIVKIDGKRVVV